MKQRLQYVYTVKDKETGDVIIEGVARKIADYLGCDVSTFYHNFLVSGTDFDIERRRDFAESYFSKEDAENWDRVCEPFRKLLEQKRRREKYNKRTAH